MLFQVVLSFFISHRSFLVWFSATKKGTAAGFQSLSEKPVRFLFHGPGQQATPAGVRGCRPGSPGEAGAPQFQGHWGHVCGYRPSGGQGQSQSW